MLSRSRSALCSVRTLVITSVLLEASSGVLLMISCSASDDPGGATLFAMTSQPIIKEGRKTHITALATNPANLFMTTSTMASAWPILFAVTNAVR